MTDPGGKLRLGVVLDAALEGWTSMDYIGEMLVETLTREHAQEVAVSALQPRTPALFGGLAGPARRARQNVDRLIARCLTYPLVVGLKRFDFDAFHITDHSYGHVVRTLPSERTGIYCHDLDALKPLLRESSKWAPHRRALAWSVLWGLQQAAVVFYNTEHVRKQISGLGLLDEKKLVHAPLGVASEFNAIAPIDDELEGCLPPGRYVLNVGSGIPRKRLELLIRTFAILRSTERDIFLVQQGARFTEAQLSLAATLGVRPVVVSLSKLSRRALAHLYRRAVLVVLPSEREGFGLPLIEALACGTPVLASDIPAFREVGGDAASYCDSADPSVWAMKIIELLRGSLPETKTQRLAQSARFSWSLHAETILSAYRALA
jgi:glycosyltransferase involved in cell wall biosynthesis